MIDAVWELYRLAHRRSPNASTLLEWDDNIPSFDEMHHEALKAREVIKNTDCFDFQSKELNQEKHRWKQQDVTPIGAHPPIMPLEGKDE